MMENTVTVDHVVKPRPMKIAEAPAQIQEKPAMQKLTTEKPVVQPIKDESFLDYTTKTISSYTKPMIDYTTSHYDVLGASLAAALCMGFILFRIFG